MPLPFLQRYLCEPVNSLSHFAGIVLRLVSLFVLILFFVDGSKRACGSGKLDHQGTATRWGGQRPDAGRAETVEVSAFFWRCTWRQTQDAHADAQRGSL
jgi:hypothetical protein